MKKIVKWIFTAVISFSLVLTFAWFFKAEAEITTTSDLKVNGAAIRTDEKTGIKFEAQASYVPDGELAIEAYGIVVMLGEQSVENVHVDAEEAYGTLVSEAVDGLYYLTIFNFPEEAYVNKITARAFVKLSDGSLVYADTVTVKSLAEVAIKAQYEEGLAGEFITTVVGNTNTNYQKVHTLGNYVYISDALYETNPTKLEVAFLKDWNEKFGTEFTEYGHTAWATSAKAGYGEGTGLTANGDTDCSGTNAYEFFITDPETSAKWGWLLTYFLEETNTFVHPKRQINALLNGGSYSDSYGGGLQQFAHLSRSLYNFFDATGGDVYGSGIDVMIKDFALYDAIADHNTTVCSVSPNFVSVGDDILLETLEKTGYEFNGYSDGTTTHVNSYVVTETKAMLQPDFTAIEYTIAYYNGETELTDLAATYNIENSVTLPTLEVEEGYEFLGWYESADFTGDVVTFIETGSTGNKVYYAKVEVKPTNDVRFVTDGGYLALYPSVDAAIADFLTDYNTARGKSHTVETFYALGSWGEISDASLFLYDATYRAKWAWLVDYIAGVASNANKVAWDTFNDYNTQAELNAANTNNIYRIAYELRGWVAQTQYTKNGNFPSADYSTAAVKAAYVTAVTLPTEYKYSEPCTLPTPIKENHTFLGWIDSEGNPVTTFPGYDENITDVIEYTATWEAIYATVNVTYDVNGGALPMSYDPNAKTASVYDNVGGASGTYLCDTSVTSKNSLRWQYKVLLQYHEDINAYEVVCLDAAKASAANAATAAGVTWTHALSNSGENITTQYTVGQYILFEGSPAVGDKNISYVVLDTPDEVAAYQYPTTYSTTYTAPAALITPTREGYKFVGWQSSVDGSVVTEFPGYVTNPGDVTYTAEWETE